MKVVFVHPSYPNQFTGIAHGLATRLGWDCAFLVNEGFTDVIRKDNPPIAYYGFRESVSANGAASYFKTLEDGTRRGQSVVEALAYLKKSVGVDMVVGHAAFGTTLFVREVVNVPVVSYVELPGYFSLYSREQFPPQYPHVLVDISLRTLIHSSVLQSDLCIVPSRHAHGLFPPELRKKIRIQMEGFDLPARVADRAVLRRELGLDDSRSIIGFAGRTLEAVRGFDIFVKVAEQVRSMRKDVQFLVIGDEATLYGNESAYLGGRSFKQYVLETERASAEGFVFKPFMPHDQFVKYLQAMDVIILPIFEGAANWGLFEAMAAGIPIVASRSCFIPEVISDGRDGILREPSDVAGFTRATLDILDQPLKFRRLGHNARQTITRRFSPEHAVRGYAAVLEEVAQKSQSQKLRVRHATTI
jgi:glycosyltransferase involved in cell wall biosynthesis